jgi:N-methylhydantoinase A/oxoprolinase/acetone carboxylase beta subunit
VVCSIDRGGTFTDVYATVPGPKGFRLLKLLSEDPSNYPDAPREGIRRILEVTTSLRCTAHVVRHQTLAVYNTHCSSKY